MPCDCKFCQFQPYSSHVLTAIEMASPVNIVLAGEDTLISDFSLSEDELRNLRKALAVPVTAEDYVWEVAKRLSRK